MKSLAFIALVLLTAPLGAQGGGAGTTGRGAGGTTTTGGARGGGGRATIIDSARAAQLYVSRNPDDLAGCGANDCERDKVAKARTDSIFAAKSKGVMNFSVVTYKSRADGLEIPALLFTPLTPRGARGHAAMVWVHDGIHGHFREMYFAFIKEAVERGYVVIAPEYRGSTGYGNDFYRKIDYGGYEVDDALSAVDYLKTLPFVDTDRLGVMGWSHGGFIAAHLLFRDDNPFKAGSAIVPVTNLIFRLSDHGASYARGYAAEERIQGLPSDRNCGPQHDRPCIDIYLERSPVFFVDKLKVPMQVDVATNDCDVFFREDQQMVYTLMALKPTLADTKIYVDPPVGTEGCGHTFSRRVNLDQNSPDYLKRNDTPEQIDSWNRTWALFARTLHPEKGGTP